MNSVLDAVVGFINSPYEFNINDDTAAEVVIGVISGTLKTSVSIELNVSQTSRFGTTKSRY